MTDPDMLEIGITGQSAYMTDCGEHHNQTCEPLSVIESRTHFGAW